MAYTGQPALCFLYLNINSSKVLKHKPMSDTKKIKEIITRFIGYLDKEGVLEEVKIKDDVVSFNLNTKEPELLIGRGGEVLFDIQRVLGRILLNQTQKRWLVDFDVNNYKKKKEKYLIELANTVVSRVVLTKKPEILDPMSAYERRIIHLIVSQRDDVESESQGEEPERRIIIKPKEV